MSGIIYIYYIVRCNVRDYVPIIHGSPFLPYFTKSNLDLWTLCSLMYDGVRVIGMKLLHSKPCSNYDYTVRFGRATYGDTISQQSSQLWAPH